MVLLLGPNSTTSMYGDDDDNDDDDDVLLVPLLHHDPTMVYNTINNIDDLIQNVCSNGCDLIL